MQLSLINLFHLFRYVGANCIIVLGISLAAIWALHSWFAACGFSLIWKHPMFISFYFHLLGLQLNKRIDIVWCCHFQCSTSATSSWDIFSWGRDNALRFFNVYCCSYLSLGFRQCTDLFQWSGKGVLNYIYDVENFSIN